MSIKIVGLELVETKKCFNCRTIKPLTEFPKHKNRAKGVGVYCLGCKSEKEKALYEERIKNRLCCKCGIAHVSDRKMCESCLEKARSHAASKKRNNPIKCMLQSAKHRASKRGWEFTITEYDIQIPDKCPILGITLKTGKGHLIDTSPTIDRIDSTLGYVKGNVKVISHRANRIKNDSTADELRKILEYMENNI